MYKGYVTAEILNVRSKPVFNSKQIGVLDQFEVITILGNKGSWLEINFSGGRAYVKCDYVAPVPKRVRLRGLTKVKEAFLWSEPSEEGSYIGSATDQIYFDVLGEKAHWLKVLFANQFAWIRSELVKQSIQPDEQQAFVSADYLNIRCKPSGRSRKLGMIKKGSKVDIVSKHGNWLKIYFQNVLGFVHKNFIRISAVAINKPLSEDQFWLSISLKPKKPVQNIKEENLKNLTVIWNRYGNLLLHLSHKFKIPPAVAVAVFAIESSGKGFINQRMIIRFENHQFFRWWGRDNPVIFNDHFSHDIRYHILGFFEFLDPLMVTALRNGDFKQFAKFYNGPGQADYYGDWLTSAYSKIVHLIKEDQIEEDTNIYRLTA